MMMKDNKAALIMNNINPDKVTEIAEKLKTKNAWRQ